MMNIILTTPEQLEEIVQKAVQKVLANGKEEKSQLMPDTCFVEQALTFLSDNGYKLSKSSLYKMTANKRIPFSYFGRRIIFSRKELLKWAKQQTTPSSSESEIMLAISKSARKKSNHYISKK